MKKIFLILMTAVSLFSCKKEDKIISDANNVGISKVTYFVDLNLNGASIMTLIKGGTFTDPGATATENGAPVTVKVSGTVDPSTPGIYTLTYSATNKDGFAKEVSRTVVVSSAPEVAGTDMSGKYSLSVAALIANVTKVGDGIYYMDNCNHPLTAFPGIFECLDGATIKFYNQPTPFGEMYSTSGSYNSTTKKAVWTITIPSQSYTRTRTFTRQ